MLPADKVEEATKKFKVLSGTICMPYKSLCLNFEEP